MKTLQKNKLFLILVVLLGLTLASWLASSSLKLSPQTLGVSILVIALIKVRLIIIHYMEANVASKPIRFAFEAWVLLVAGITISLYAL